MAPAPLAAAAHSQRARLARLAGDPERAMTETIASRPDIWDLIELAAVSDRTFERSPDERHGRAALAAYRGIAERGDDPAWAAAKHIADLELRLAQPRGAGSIDKLAIKAAFLERVPAFTACYRQVLERDPATRGTITIKATVGNDGHLIAHRVSPVPGARGLSAVSGCVDRIVDSITFPQMRWSPTAVVYFPLVMRPEATP